MFGIRFRYAAIVFLLGAAPLARAQWQMQTSGTKASLRGIYSIDANTVWASGTSGTVLRSLDGGQHWQTCSVPKGAAALDFRSVWAWDANHAMVMSSGTGPQSRLYSTHDGCRTWRLVFSNPDANGFWDALQFDGARFGAILGDPVDGRFVLFVTYDGGLHWTRQVDACLHTEPTAQGAFAASNQALAVLPIEDSDADANVPPGFAANHQIWFGASGGWLYGMKLQPLEAVADNTSCVHTQVLADEWPDRGSAGIFAVAFRDGVEGVAVGGDYLKPQNGTATAAYTSDGVHWQRALLPPAGYRSTVAWDTSDGSWIAAGPGGSDISRDGGKTWRLFDNESWNALSLPFAVGPDGRIGRLISWGQLRAQMRTGGQLHAQLRVTGPLHAANRIPNHGAFVQQ